MFWDGFKALKFNFHFSKTIADSSKCRLHDLCLSLMSDLVSVIKLLAQRNFSDRKLLQSKVITDNHDRFIYIEHRKM